jgi:hypothetical protein
MSALKRLHDIGRIIEIADTRALAVDGPVSHVRDTMTDKEWRQLYLLTQVPKEFVALEEAAKSIVDAAIYEHHDIVKDPSWSEDYSVPLKLTVKEIRLIAKALDYKGKVTR